MWNERAALCAAVFGVLACGSAAGQFSWDESVDGDLTGDRFAPQLLVAAEGTNTITGTVIAGDLDYFRFVVPDGLELAEINLVDYQSTADQIAFIAVQSGSEFTVDADAADPTTLLGYLLYGPTNVGLNVIDDIGMGPGSIGFSGPLPAGEYSFWNQQTGSDLTTYSFEFVLVPGPGSLALLGAAGLGAVRRRR
ncbi:MAG: hypothetical protein AAGF47_09355 [Planctomycetota bacterium]